MKKLLKVAVVALCVIFTGNFAKAQVKIGYINSNDLVQAMPELATVKTQMDAYQKPYLDGVTGLQKELQDMGQQYEAKQASMTDAERTLKQGEIQDIQKRLQTYQTTAQQAVDAKSNELMKPIIDKAHNAIDAVAKEKGFTYVFDSSATGILVSPPGDDMLAAVKLKLGIK